ncbi:DUF3107 domain-containing protein [Sanguibacter sp. A247]|uniref:DUF3107 domain-containing protein n=1 Tax=unclassified Sanguibacter TaxID=2645534 RepID=UPI003FD8925D
MEITIGVQNLTREIVVETEANAEEIAASVAKALDGGTVLDLTDHRGRRVLIPTATIAYVEIGAEEQRRVGFGSL